MSVSMTTVRREGHPEARPRGSTGGWCSLWSAETTTINLSKKSLAEDGASTRALASSLLAYRMEKMENTSVDTQCSLNLLIF